MKNLRMFRKLCGENGLGSVALVTSMWSLCTLEDGERREQQLLTQNDLWNYLLDKGAKSFRHDVRNIPLMLFAHFSAKSLSVNS